MMNSQAAKASPRWAPVTTTSTMLSPGRKGPTRWMTVASRMSQRPRASSTMAASEFSVMPG